MSDQQQPVQDSPRARAVGESKGVTVTQGGTGDAGVGLAGAEAVRAVGAQLEQLRKSKGWSVDDVSARLKVPPAKLRQLEAGDLSRMPGNTFAIGVVRSYAKMLGIDPAPLSDALRRSGGAEQTDLSLPAPSGADMPRSRAEVNWGTAPKRRPWLWAVALAVVALAALALWRAGGESATLLARLKESAHGASHGGSGPASAASVNVNGAAGKSGMAGESGAASESDAVGGSGAASESDAVGGSGAASESDTASGNGTAGGTSTAGSRGAASASATASGLTSGSGATSAKAAPGAVGTAGAGAAGASATRQTALPAPAAGRLGSSAAGSASSAAATAAALGSAPLAPVVAPAASLVAANTAGGHPSTSAADGAPPANQASVTIKVTHDSWFSIRQKDGKEVFSGMVRAGDEKNVQGAAPFKVTVGNTAGLASLALDGKAVDPSKYAAGKGNVARFTLP